MKLTRLTRLAAATAVSTLAASAGVLAFAPSAFAAASATATPSANLVDQQIISVSGGGMPAGATIQIEECSGTVANPPSDNTSCDAISLDTQAVADRSGNFTNAPGDANGDTGYMIYTLGVPGSKFGNDGSGVRCDYKHSCVLYVGTDQNNFPGAPHTFVGVTFAPPAVAPVSPTPQAITLAQGANKTITVNYGTANDGNGNPETITGSSTVVTAPTHGTAVTTSPGVFKYTNTDTNATSDTFTVGGATASCPATCTGPATATGNNVVVNVTLTSVSPNAPASPTPQSLTVPNLGAGSITVNYGTANDSNGTPETITPSSTVVTAPTHGTAVATSPGVFKYTNTDGTQTTDSFVVAGATATCASGVICHPSSATGNNVTINVTIIGKPSSVTVAAGSGQSTQINTPFPTNLAAKVTDAAGHLLSGVTVTFTAPASGASATFPGPSVTATAVTDSSGVATAPTLTANGATGSYAVAATVAGTTSSASFSLTNVQVPCQPPHGASSGPIFGLPVVGPILGPLVCKLGL